MIIFQSLLKQLKKWKRMATSQKQQPRTKELLGFWLENYINNNQLL